MKKELLACASTVPLMVTSLACSPSPPTETARAAGSATEPPVVPTVPIATGSVPVVGSASISPSSSAPSAAAMTSASERLVQRAVEAPAIGRRVLLSWTSRKQAEEIVGGQPILTRTESAQHGPSGFDWALDAKVGKGERLARLLFHEGFAKKRFAWPNAYATALGGGGGRYGAVLLRLELKQDALLADLGTGAVMTVDSKPATLEELEAHPERLAAVYWESPEFREYVVVNEAALARVSFGTPDALGIFEEERKLLTDLAAGFTALKPFDQSATLSLLAKTLAFAKTADERALRAFAKEATDVPPDTLAFSAVPKREFRLGATRQRLKNPGCKLKKSFDVSYRRTFCEPYDKCKVVGGSKCELISRTLNDGD